MIMRKNERKNVSETSETRYNEEGTGPRSIAVAIESKRERQREQETVKKHTKKKQ
jgi:hypothetical protein